MVSGHAIDLAKSAASAGPVYWRLLRPAPLLDRTALFAGLGDSGRPGTALLRFLHQNPRSRSYGLKGLAGGRGRPSVGELEILTPPTPERQPATKAAAKPPPLPKAALGYFTTSRDGDEELPGGTKGGDHRLDPVGHLLGGAAVTVDEVKVNSGQERVVLAEATGEGLGQLGDLGAHPPFGQVRELPRAGVGSRVPALG